MRLLASAVALATLIAGPCLGAACDAAPPVAAAVPAPPDPAFVRAVRAADAVFEGVIVDVGRAPGAWSGSFAVHQAVSYRVTRIARDPERRLRVGERVQVQHVLVEGSATADTTPRLRPSLVRAGAGVIVLARWTSDHWTGVDEHHGIVAADAAHRAALAQTR
jgi:hypothetical protein